MIISAIDNRNDLFAIKNIIPNNLIEALSNEDITDYTLERQPMQEDFCRYRVCYDQDTVIGKIVDSILWIPNFWSPNSYSLLEKINKIIGSNFSHIDASVWYDYEGFKMEKHIDNPSIKSAMQIYLDQGNINLGTTFYFVDDKDIEIKDDIQQWHLKNYNLNKRHNFKYIPNTGYLMLNNKYQAHGPSGFVDNNERRLSLYCYLK